MINRALIIVIIIVSLGIVGVIGYVFTNNKLIDRPSMDEKQVIDYLYDYLMSRAEQQRIKYLPGTDKPIPVNESEKELIINIIFIGSIGEANKESFNEGEVGQFISVLNRPGRALGDFPTNTEALKRLAKYNGNGLWTVSIWGIWQVNERTKEVTPQNQEAAAHLKEISPKTYTSSAYRYSINYPPTWNLDDTDKGHVLLWSPDAKASVEILIRDTQSQQYRFTDQSAKDWVEAIVELGRKKFAYFELIRKEQIKNGQGLVWDLEYIYKPQDAAPLLWARHRSWFTTWRQYDVAIQASKADRDFYLTQLSDILESFKLSP